MIENITTNEFQENVLDHKGNVLVDFYSDTCVPCKILAKTLEEIANENPQIKIYKINAMDEHFISGRYNIQSVPTLILFKDGMVEWQSIGLVGKEEIVGRILGDE